MLFRIYGCLVVHRKCIFWKCFSVGLSTGVNWFLFLFYLQIPIFRKTKRELSERETRPCAEREREETELRQTQKPTPTNPENPRPSLFVTPIEPPARSLHPSTDPPKTDRSCRTPKLIVLDPKTDRPPSLPSSLNLTGLWFFFSGFYLCFWIEEWNYIFIWQLRKCEKMCFLWYFQQHNQTPENIFHNIFWNATKHLKIFSFPENSISGN